MLNGVNLLNVFTNVRTRMAEVLDWERGQNYVGGNSSVLLFLLNSGNINNNNEVLEAARSINDTIPGMSDKYFFHPLIFLINFQFTQVHLHFLDMRVLFGTSTHQFDALWNLVRDMHNDIFTINLSSNGEGIATAMTQLLNKIRSSMYSFTILNIFIASKSVCNKNLSKFMYKSISS